MPRKPAYEELERRVKELEASELEYQKTIDRLRQNEEIFRDGYYIKLARQVPVEGNVVSWEEVHEDPKPRLYLTEVGGELQARLRFAYGDLEVRYDRSMPVESISRKDASWTLARILRSPAQETELYTSVGQARYGLKRYMIIS